nr:HAMP domain-containing histidine kinase [Pseudopedobacter sp.]
MKLLSYNSQRYLILSALLILLSIPIFYFVVSTFFLKSVDESLALKASFLPDYIHNIKNPNDLELWKKVDSDLKIKVYKDGDFKTQPFTTEAYSKISKEVEQYRNLQKKFTLFNQDYIITFRTSLVEKEDLLQSILFLQIGLLLFLFLGSIFINRRISKKIWQPFRDILNFLQNFELGQDLNPEQKKLKIDEFNDLNQEIYQLINRTQKTYTAQKEFTENAAHELQTPIAIIKSKLELFYQDGKLSNNQSILIDQINSTLNKLDELNKSLLLLAKIENQQFDFKANIDLKTGLEETVQELEFLAESRNQSIKLWIPQPIVIKGNATLIHQLFKNLIINAIQYAPLGEEINISCDASGILITNKGIPLDFPIDKLFKRFSKNNTHQSHSGNGLGLAIAKKIADFHQLKLTYQYVGDEHQFSLSL